MDARLDFLAVAEHRLIPARVRSEWARLKSKGVASIWALASQDSSHVGNAGVGVVSLRGAPSSLPTFATAQFKRFFDCGRAVRCMLPLGSGRFMHLVVLYGYQGADANPEQFALTDHLFDAALGELSVVARGHPCMLVGDFNVELTKIPCLAKGISAGLWVDLEEAWALAAGLRPAPTCKRTWSAPCGHRRDFMVGCPLAVAAVLSCKVQADRWVAPHLAVRTLFDCDRWSCRVRRFGKSMIIVCSSCLGRMLLFWMSLNAGDVSQAWLVWSSAAETALADAYWFSGSPAPSRGLVLGRGCAWFRVGSAWWTSGSEGLW